MKIKHLLEELDKTLKELEGIDFTDRHKWKVNQKKVNDIYRILENLKQEIVKESRK